MIKYNTQLALKSLGDRFGLTTLMVLAIGVGLGLYMTTVTMSYQSNKVPLSNISQSLYLVQMDNRELEAENIDMAKDLGISTFKDAMNMLAMQNAASQQTIAWNTGGILNVQNDSTLPLPASIGASTSNFFSMFEVPFLYGSGWTTEADLAQEAVIVLSKATNQHLFGGDNSIGKTVRIGTNSMRIVGVIDDWFVSARFYDRTYYGGFPDAAFVPSSFAINADMPRQMQIQCPSTETAPWRFRNSDIEELIASECTWVAFWARINSKEDLSQYQAQVGQYVEQQKTLGRFARAQNNFVTNINQQIGQRTGNGWNEVLNIVGVLFFIVCLINAISILLAKFMRRTKEVSLRRALGAKRSTLMQQYLIEVLIIGVIGGIIGIIMAYLGLEAMLRIQLYAMDYMLTEQDMRPYFVMDWIMIMQSFAIAIVSALVVGLFPIWRICSISPAGQLKAQ